MTTQELRNLINPIPTERIITERLGDPQDKTGKACVWGQMKKISPEKSRGFHHLHRKVLKRIGYGLIDANNHTIESLGIDAATPKKRVLQALDLYDAKLENG